MPITPLHLAAGFPAQSWLNDKFSMKSFIATNILIDVEPATVMYLGLDYPLHGTIHSLLGATIVGALVGLFFSLVWRESRKKISAAWVGALFGAWSHILLDALVHTDVQLLWPWAEGNAIYMGWMEPLSFVCFVVTLGYVVPWLLKSVHDIRRRWLE